MEGNSIQYIFITQKSNRDVWLCRLMFYKPSVGVWGGRGWLWTREILETSTEVLSRQITNEFKAGFFRTETVRVSLQQWQVYGIGN